MSNPLTTPNTKTHVLRSYKLETAILIEHINSLMYQQSDKPIGQHTPLESALLIILLIQAKRLFIKQNIRVIGWLSVWVAVIRLPLL